MNSVGQTITLSEWETTEPDRNDKLVGRFLDNSDVGKRVVAQLAKSRLIELTELRNGLRIRSFSHVGRIQIGDLNVVVRPKLRGSSMLGLLRYAYGFRRLQIISETAHFSEPCGFEDLLVAQLNAEAQELLSRGLQRAYVARSESLESPRGRINIEQVALQGGIVSATLPCTHFPCIEDTLLNRALLSGLTLAGGLASSVELRRESKRLAGLMDEQVSPVSLNLAIMHKVERRLNRLNKNYQPAMSIIGLLVESQGIALEGESTTMRLPGFMFDMNAFYQAILSRFLRENLPEYSVVDEHSLKGMMRYNPNFNPPRRSPTPRPDFVIKSGSAVCAVLDAKYRDIWDKRLPQHMLYQLVVYAVSKRDNPVSTIVYPTFNTGARETRIDVSEPVYGNNIGQVRMFPVNLERLEALVNDLTELGRRERVGVAMKMAQLDV